MKSRTFVPRLTLLKYRFKSILFLIAIATEKLQGSCVLFFAVVSFRRGGGGVWGREGDTWEGECQRVCEIEMLDVIKS